MKKELFSKAVRITLYILICINCILIAIFSARLVAEKNIKQINTIATTVEPTMTLVPVSHTENLISEQSSDTPTPQYTEEIVPEPIDINMPYADPETMGFNQEKLDDLTEYMHKFVAQGLPGATIVVAKNGYIIYQESFGYSKIYEGEERIANPIKMQDDTLFDLNSLSKVFGTTLAIMKLVDDGLLDLDDTISEYLSGFDEGNKKDITIKMLLSHNSGYTKEFIYFYKEKGELYSQDRETTLSILSKIPLNEKPGKVYDYSNTNFIILGAIIEEISGMRLDEFTREKIYYPLNLQEDVAYVPLKYDIPLDRIAATEALGNTKGGTVDFPGIREYTVHGETHDEISYYSMGGVSGHAGLFASSVGLTVLDQMLLNGGEYKGVRIFKQETVDQLLKIYNKEKYQLCIWNAKKVSSIASSVSNLTFNHTGGTGTTFILDVENKLSIVYLTNKKHSPCIGGTYKASSSKYSEIINRVYNALDS